MTEPVYSLHDTRLRWAFQFDDEDLAANRLGYFSQVQYQRAQTLKQRTLKYSVILGMVCAVALCLLSSVTPKAEASKFVFQALCIGPFTILGTLALVLFLESAIQRFLLKRDARLDNVISLMGPVRKEIFGLGSTRPHYRLIVNNEIILVSEDVFNGFSDGLSYRLYRARASGLILSAEFISNTNQKTKNN